MDTFVRIGDHFIHLGAIASFGVYSSGTGEVVLFNGQTISVNQWEARTLTDYLVALSADLRKRREFPSGAYPTLTDSYSKRTA